MNEAATCKLASVLLQYPTAALFDGLGELDAFAATTSPRQARAAFARFLAWLRATAPADVAEHVHHRGQRRDVPDHRQRPVLRVQGQRDPVAGD